MRSKRLQPVLCRFIFLLCVRFVTPACHPFQQGVVSVAAMGTSRALEKAFDGWALCIASVACGRRMGWLVVTGRKHTYLAQGLPWSRRRFPQGEAWPLHTWAGLTPAIIPHVDNSCAQFLVAGKCVRAHPDLISITKRHSKLYQHNRKRTCFTLQLNNITPFEKLSRFLLEKICLDMSKWYDNIIRFGDNHVLSKSERVLSILQEHVFEFNSPFNYATFMFDFSDVISTHLENTFPNKKRSRLSCVESRTIELQWAISAGSMVQLSTCTT